MKCMIYEIKKEEKENSPVRARHGNCLFKCKDFKFPVKCTDPV